MLMAVGHTIAYFADGNALQRKLYSDRGGDADAGAGSSFQA
jgi:hypothetical protein